MGAFAMLLRNAFRWFVNAFVFDLLFIMLAIMFAIFQVMTNETMTMDFYFLSRQMQLIAIYVFSAEFILRLCANGFGGWLFHDDKGAEKWMLPGCSQGSFVYDLLFYFNEKGVFVEFWSLLDLFVLLEQIIAYNNAEFPNVIMLKALSVCKVLQHVRLLHLPKIVVVTAFQSIAKLGGLLISCLFFVLLFAIMGMNMFGLNGDMRRVCARMHMYPDAELINDTVHYLGFPITDNELWQPMARPCTLLNDSSVSSVFCDLSFPILSCDLSTASICSSVAPDTSCVDLGVPIGNTLYHFEDLISAALGVVTSWFFKDFMNQMDNLKRTSEPIYVVVFFMVCSLLGGFVVLNLTVATTAKCFKEVCKKLDDALEQELALEREEERKIELRERAYLESLSKKGDIIENYHIDTIRSLWRFFLLPWLHWAYVFRTLTAVQLVLFVFRVLTFNFVFVGWLLDSVKLQGIVDLANEKFTQTKVQEYLDSLKWQEQRLLHVTRPPNFFVQCLNYVLYFPLQNYCSKCGKFMFKYEAQRCGDKSCDYDCGQDDFYKQPNDDQMYQSIETRLTTISICGTPLLRTINQSLRQLHKVQRTITRMEGDSETSEVDENDDAQSPSQNDVVQAGPKVEPYFTRMTDCIISINTVLLLFSTFAAADSYASGLYWLQVGLVAFFLIECLLRLLAIRSFRLYIQEGSNFPELLLVILNLIGFIWKTSLDAAGEAPSDTASLLSATRIFQALKLFRHLGADSFLPVLGVLQKSFKSPKLVLGVIAANCFFLLVFGVIGIELFGGCVVECEASAYNGNAGIYTGVSNPFTALHTSFVALFVLSTGDLFSSYIYYGSVSNYFGIPYWIVFNFLGNYVFLRIFIALIVSNFDISEEERVKIQRSHAQWTQLNANLFESSEFIQPTAPPLLQKVLTVNLETSLNTISNLIDLDNEDEYKEKEVEWMTALAQRNIDEEKKRAATQASSVEEVSLIKALSVMFSILKPVQEGDSEEAVNERKHKFQVLNSTGFKEDCRQMADRIADFLQVPQTATQSSDASSPETHVPEPVDMMTDLCYRVRGSNDEGLLVLKEALANTHPTLDRERFERYSTAICKLDQKSERILPREPSFENMILLLSGIQQKVEKWAFKFTMKELPFGLLKGQSAFDTYVIIVVLFSVYLSISKSEGNTFMNSERSALAMEYFLVFFFIFEMILRGFANGLVAQTKLAQQHDITPILKDPLKAIDVIVIFLMIIDTIFKIKIPDSLMVLRILKILTPVSQSNIGLDEDTPWVDAPIKSLFAALSNAKDEVACILFFLLSVIILFAYIISTIYPEGSFDFCNEGDDTHLEDCIGVKFDQNGYGYLATRYVAGFNQFGFGTDDVLETIKTLVHVLSQDGWSAILDATMKSSGSVFWRWEAVIPFFLFFMYTYLTAVFVSQLSIGTFIIQIQLAQGNGLFTLAQQRWAATRKNLGKCLKYIGDKDPPRGWRKFMYRLSESSLFQSIMTLIICANVLVMALETYPVNPNFQTAARYLNSFFLVLFLVEILSKLFGYKFDTIKAFGFSVSVPAFEVRSDNWVKFDVFVIGLSVLDLWLFPLFSVPPVSWLRAVRSLRIFRLVKKHDALQLICSTIWNGIPVIFAGLGLMLLWSVIFGTIAIEFFGKIKEGIVLSATDNFGTFAGSLTLMFRIMCGDGWWGLLDDVTIEQPYCSGPDCGVAWGSWFLICYWVGINFIFTPLLIASLIQYFTLESSDEMSYVKERDCQIFNDVWKTHENLVKRSDIELRDDPKDGKCRHEKFQESYRLKLMHLKPFLCALKDEGCVLGFDPSGSRTSKKKYEEVEIMIVAKVVASFWSCIARDKSDRDPTSPGFQNPHANSCSSCRATKAKDPAGRPQLCKFFKTIKDKAASIDVDDNFDGAVLYQNMSVSDLFNRWNKSPSSEDTSGWDEYQRERKHLMACEILDFDSVCYILASFLNEKVSLTTVDFLNEAVGTENILKFSIYKDKIRGERSPEDLIENFRMHSHSLAVIEHRISGIVAGDNAADDVDDDPASLDRSIKVKHSRIQAAISANKIAESLAPSRPQRIIVRNFDDSGDSMCMDFGAFINGVYILGSESAGLSNRLVYKKMRSNRDMNSFMISLNGVHKITVMSAPVSYKKSGSIGQFAVLSSQRDVKHLFVEHQKSPLFVDADDFIPNESDDVLYAYNCSLECFRSSTVSRGALSIREDWVPKDAVTSEGMPVSQGDLCWAFFVTFSGPERLVSLNENSTVTSTSSKSDLSLNKDHSLKIPLAMCWSQCEESVDMRLPSKVNFPLHPVWYILKASPEAEDNGGGESANESSEENPALPPHTSRAATDAVESRYSGDQSSQQEMLASDDLITLQCEFLQLSQGQSSQSRPDELVFKRYKNEEDIDFKIPEAVVSEPLQRIILSGCGSLKLKAKSSSSVLPFVNVDLKSSQDSLKKGDYCYAFRAETVSHNVARVMDILIVRHTVQHAKEPKPEKTECSCVQLMFLDGLFVNLFVRAELYTETTKILNIEQLVDSQWIPLKSPDSVRTLFCDFATPETSLKKCVIDGEYVAVPPDPGLTITEYKRVGTKHQLSLKFESAALTKVTVYKIRNQRGKCARFCCMFPHGLSDGDTVQDFDFAFRRNIHFLTFFATFRAGFERAYFENFIDKNHKNLSDSRRSLMLKSMRDELATAQKENKRLPFPEMEKWIVSHALEIWTSKRKEAEQMCIVAAAPTLTKEQLHSKVNASLYKRYDAGTSIKEKRIFNDVTLPVQFRDLFADIPEDLLGFTAFGGKQAQTRESEPAKAKADGAASTAVDSEVAEQSRSRTKKATVKKLEALPNDHFDPFERFEDGDDGSATRPAFQNGCEYKVVDASLTEFSLVPEDRYDENGSSEEWPRIQFNSGPCDCCWFPDGFPDGFTIYAADAKVASGGGPPLPVTIDCGDTAAIPIPFCEYLFQCVPETFEGWVIDGHAARTSGPFLALDVPQHLSTLNDYDTCIDPFCVQFHEQPTIEKSAAPWILMHGTNEQLCDVLALWMVTADSSAEKSNLRNRLRQCLDQDRSAPNTELKPQVRDSASVASSIMGAGTLKSAGVFRSVSGEDASEREFVGEWKLLKEFEFSDLGNSVSFTEKELRVFPVDATYELVNLRENEWDFFAVKVCEHVFNGIVADLVDWATSVQSLSTADAIICHWAAPSIDASRDYYGSGLLLPVGAEAALPAIKDDSWLEHRGILKLLQNGMPVSSMSEEQSFIKREQRKVRRQPAVVDVDVSAEDAVVVTMPFPLVPTPIQNPFVQLSNSVLSPLSRAGLSLTSSVMSMFGQDVVAPADMSGALDASQKPPRRKKRVSVADRLTCAAPRDADDPASAAAAADSNGNGVFSAVFAACGGSRGGSGLAAPPPSSDSRDAVVAVRKQKSRGAVGKKQVQSESGEGGGEPVEEMDV